MEAFIIDWQAGENATKFKMTVRIQAFKVTFRHRPQVSGYFRIRNFFSADSASVHPYPVNPQLLNPLSRVEIFEYVMNIWKRVDGTLKSLLKIEGAFVWQIRI